MSATKILWGQILTVFAIVLLTTWAATQWTAYRLGFQPQLGLPWFMVGGWPIYYPWSFFPWWYFYDAYAPPIFVEGAYIAASGGFISIAVAIASGSAGSTYTAASPATSCSTGRSERITGQPRAIASRGGRPKPSNRVGKTSAVDSR